MFCTHTYLVNKIIMVVPVGKSQAVHGRYEMLSPQPMSKEAQQDDDKEEIDGLRYVSFIK